MATQTVQGKDRFYVETLRNTTVVKDRAENDMARGSYGKLSDALGACETLNRRERARLLNALLKQYEERLGYFYCRWQDEKEYEDWADYAEAMKKLVDETEGVDFVRATKRPFGFTLLHHGLRLKVRFYANSRYLGWKVI